MENKKHLINRVKIFRDNFKEYLDVCCKIWKARNNYDSGDQYKETEKDLREKLTEEWGRLESIFKKIKAPMFTIIPSIGQPTLFFDEALSHDFDSPHKYEGIEHAISSATKAIGLIDSFSEQEYKGLNRKTPNIFLSYAFRDENDKLVSDLKEILASFPVSIITGLKPGTDSISEKVKGLIDDSDFILSVLTKDNEQKNGKFTPSKWVLDEIAYGLGQKKTIIRLLEKGVLYKGAIFGDDEYISFERENLTNALIKLVQVVNSLLNK